MAANGSVGTATIPAFSILAWNQLAPSCHPQASKASSPLAPGTLALTPAGRAHPALSPVGALRPSFPSQHRLAEGEDDFATRALKPSFGAPLGK